MMLYWWRKPEQSVFSVQCRLFICGGHPRNSCITAARTLGKHTVSLHSFLCRHHKLFT